MCLIICEARSLSQKAQKRERGQKEALHHKLNRVMHCFEGLINDLSIQQSITGLGLVVTAAHVGCSLSAYVYNLICLLVLMSVITNLNALTNTRNWFTMNSSAPFRSICYGVVRVVPIIATIGLAGVMILSRSRTDFPMGPGPKVTLRAVCFEGQSLQYLKDNAIGPLQKFPTGDLDASYWTSGVVQYVILLVDIMLVGIIFMVALLKKCCAGRPNGFRGKLSLFLRAVSTLLTSVALAWLSAKYYALRAGVEGNSAYWPAPSTVQTIQGVPAGNWTPLNVISTALLASSIIGVAKSFADSYEGRPGAGKSTAHSYTELNEHFGKWDQQNTAYTGQPTDISMTSLLR